MAWRSPRNGPDHERFILRGILVTLLLLAIGAAVWWLRAPDTASSIPDPAAERAKRELLDELEQRVTTLNRSDQISREANRDLQSSLAEREEEIAALRADVAFYERLVGATGQRRGLTVHELKLKPQAGTAWHFSGILTQNLNRGAVSVGQVTLSLEGTQDGKVQRLSWDALRQQDQAPGVPYSFKYFQPIEGELFVPPGVTPVRLTVRLIPRGRAGPVEQSFNWAEVTSEEATASR